MVELIRLLFGVRELGGFGYFSVVLVGTRLHGFVLFGVCLFYLVCFVIHAYWFDSCYINVVVVSVIYYAWMLVLTLMIGGVFLLCVVCCVVHVIFG